MICLLCLGLASEPSPERMVVGRYSQIVQSRSDYGIYVRTAQQVSTPVAACDGRLAKACAEWRFVAWERIRHCL